MIAHIPYTLLHYYYTTTTTTTTTSHLFLPPECGPPNGEVDIVDKIGSNIHTHTTEYLDHIHTHKGGKKLGLIHQGQMVRWEIPVFIVMHLNLLLLLCFIIERIESVLLLNALSKEAMT